jgi:hypothetical protein
MESTRDILINEVPAITKSGRKAKAAAIPILASKGESALLLDNSVIVTRGRELAIMVCP